MTDDRELDAAWTEGEEGYRWRLSLGWTVWTWHDPKRGVWDYGCESEDGRWMASRFTRSGEAAAERMALDLCATVQKIRNEEGEA